MAPLPKRRHSSARQSKRTRALKVSQVTLVSCSHCKALRKPHQVCPGCGYYNGKVVVVKKEKKKK